MLKIEEKVLAFSFAAGEFLDEELSEWEQKISNKHEFFTKGECRVNKGSKHPFEYWTTQESIDAINALYKKIT